jgi:hypothetical protein
VLKAGRRYREEAEMGIGLRERPSVVGWQGCCKKRRTGKSACATDLLVSGLLIRLADQSLRSTNLS